MRIPAIVFSSLIPLWAAALPRVELRVADNAGVVRQGEIVTSGIPFAQGALAPNAAIRIEDERGRPVPTQTRLLGTWPDGSAKWVLVHFPADCASNAESRYYVAAGTAPMPRQRISVNDGVDAVTIDTGVLRARIPKGRLAVLGAVEIREAGRYRHMLRESVMTFELAGQPAHSTLEAIPERVEITESGPLRATVRVTGWVKGPERWYRLDSRLRFFAGLPSVEGEHTVTVLGGPKAHELRRISIDLRHEAGQGGKYEMPSGSGTLPSDAPAVLLADTDLAMRSGLEGSLAVTPQPVAGWARVSGANGSFGVAVRHFRHMAPKAIEVAEDRVRLDLWTPRTGKLLRFGRGRAITHRILYDFAGAGQSGRLRAFENRLIASTTPEYFCLTKAFKTLSPFGAPETREYDRKVEITFESLRKARDTDPNENGMQHFGDYYHGGYGNKLTRGNLEYDTAHALFLHYARSGDRRFYDYAAECNQHFIDMDINQETGDQLFHGYAELADIHEEITTRLDWGHVFTDGPADTYFLTGDERSLEAVKTVADRLNTLAEGDGFDKIRTVMASAERHVGWPMLALARAFEVTGDEKYMATMRKIVEYIKLYAQDPMAEYRQGKWWRSWMMDGCKAFMVGAVHEGLGAYYDLTGDKDLIPVVKKSLDWMIDYLWEPKTGGFVYEFNAMNRPHRHYSHPELNMMVVDAFRSGYEMTRDRRYLAVAVHAFHSRVREMKAPQDGKTFTIDTRTSPHTAAFLWREKIAPGQLPAPPVPDRLKDAPVPPLGDRPEILLKAGFDGDLRFETPAGAGSGQQVGTTAFVEGRRGKALAVGQGGYAWLPAPADLLRGPGSIELWVRLNYKLTKEKPQQGAVFHVEGATPLIDSLGLVTIYHELRVRMKNHRGILNGTAEGETTAWNPGEWHHVVVTWDQSRVRIYFDGAEQVRPDEGKWAWDGVNGFAGGPQTRINLGWRFGNWYCASTVDELTVFGRALSAAEVAARYAEQAGR